jgi:hypothetical protein
MLTDATSFEVCVIFCRFSSKLSHMVFSPADKAFAVEIYDDPAAPSIARIELV